MKVLLSDCELPAISPTPLRTCILSMPVFRLPEAKLYPAQRQHRSMRNREERHGEERQEQRSGREQGRLLIAAPRGRAVGNRAAVVLELEERRAAARESKPNLQMVLRPLQHASGAAGTGSQRPGGSQPARVIPDGKLISERLTTTTRDGRFRLGNGDHKRNKIDDRGYILRLHCSQPFDSIGFRSDP